MAGLNLFTNNAATTLASSINSSVTSLSVAAGTGALFPTLAGSQFFYCTLSNTAGTTLEIVKVTARSTDTFTIVRGQNGTTAASFSAGDKVELRLVEASLSNFGQLDSTNTWASAQTFSAAPIFSTLTGLLKGNGASAATAATAGTDYAAPGTASTWTAQQTFTGTSSVISSKFVNALEGVTVSATAATGTINYDVTTQSVLYYTTNASANWTVNFRGSSGTSLNTAMATGEAITVVFLVSQGSTAYYNSAVQVDGTSVTPKYQGGTAWTAGNASGVDAYSYTIIKTGSATFSVFASQTQFK